MCLWVVVQVVQLQAVSYGCTAEIDWMLDKHPYYPPTVNDPQMSLFVKRIGGRSVPKLLTTLQVCSVKH